MANPTCRNRADLVTFIMDACSANDGTLAQGLLGKNSAQDIYDYFQLKGYVDIPLSDCRDILDAGKKFRNKGIDRNGNAVEVDPGAGY